MRERFVEWGAPWNPAEVGARAKRVRDGSFEFVGVAARLPDPDWTGQQVSPLWSYNLQYFDYARELAWAAQATGEQAYAAKFVTLARSWITATAHGGRPAWDSYPLSLRIVNWIYAVEMAAALIDEPARDALAVSLYRQLCVLEQRIERHILANHLIKNLVALAIGGLWFCGARSARWLDTAVSGLAREAERQVNDDGGHAERSPMYHAIVMADFFEAIDLLRAASVPVPAGLVDRIARMPDAYGKLMAANGSPRLFNDSARGIAPRIEYLDRLAKLVTGSGVGEPKGSWSLPSTGFHGFRDARVSIAIEAGPPAPSYQPAHAHCGLLSFELEVEGVEIVVDSGVHGYDGDPLREYVRSTRAHNTVAIGNRDQNEMWGTFRVARRAVMREVKFAPTADFAFLGAYSPFFDRATVHRREIRRDGDAWVVTDQVVGSAGRRLESYLHFHPDATISREGTECRVSRAGIHLVVESFGAEDVNLVRGSNTPVQGWHCPRFGEAREASVLVMTVHANAGAEFGFRITRAEGRQ